jgi:hypothetical protein
LKALKMPLADFWTIAAKFGMSPIINKPTASASEAWHFDNRVVTRLYISTTLTKREIILRHIKLPQQAQFSPSE